MAIEVLADLLPRFIMEAKSQDEILYLAATLMQLVVGIQSNFRKNGQPTLGVIRTLVLYELVVLLMHE